MVLATLVSKQQPSNPAYNNKVDFHIAGGHVQTLTKRNSVIKGALPLQHKATIVRIHFFLT